MYPVDESVRLVELPPKLGAVSAMKRCASRRDAPIILGFYPSSLRDISTRYSSNDPSIWRACAVDASSTNVRHRLKDASASRAQGAATGMSMCTLKY
jgi:hypothetical protein